MDDCQVKDVADLVMVIWAGFQYILGSGSYSSGSSSMTYAVIGMVLIAGTWYMINTIGGIVGNP